MLQCLLQLMHLLLCFRPAHSFLALARRLFRWTRLRTGPLIAQLCSLCMQIKVKKVETDLLIDQLWCVFGALATSKVPTTKFEKRLEEVAHKCVAACVCV